eukprot:6192511-Pleurochrysis_carterae.AAC.1
MLIAKSISHHHVPCVNVAEPEENWTACGRTEPRLSPWATAAGETSLHHSEPPTRTQAHMHAQARVPLLVHSFDSFFEMTPASALADDS